MHNNPKRFYSLDILRGIAAIIVVIYHWGLFEKYFPGDSIQQLPLSNYFDIIYRRGLRSVDLFFTLSGFIFFLLYKDKVFANKISFLNFIVKRISRLYPLHLLTLFLVLFLRMLTFKNFGFVRELPDSDTLHFITQFLMISSWGITPGYSFNGASWSISIEFLLYILFYINCKIKIDEYYKIITMIIASFIINHHNSEISRGILSFYLGSVSYFLYYYCTNQFGVKMMGLIAIISGILCILSMMGMKLFDGVPLNPHAVFSIKYFLLFFIKNLDIFVLFPLFIFLLAIVERFFVKITSSFIIGEASYSMYLLHYPLQIIFINISKLLGIRGDFYSTASSMLLFFGILIPLSCFVYRNFEYPVQTKIRKKFLEKTLEENKTT